MTNTDKNVEIVDKRKAFAEFMGVKYYPDEKIMRVFEDKFDDGIVFHCEWHPNCRLLESNHMAWAYEPDLSYCQLMPVWFKFRDLPIKKSRGKSFRNSDFEAHLALIGKVSYSICFETLSEAFEALYEAIFWFNNLNK